MANKQQRQKLYESFETGDRPSQLEFEDFIDSGINQQDDDVWVDDQDNDQQGNPNPYRKYLGVGTREPVARFSVSGETVIGGDYAGKRPDINANNLPANGLVVEGGVRIGMFDPSHHKVVIKAEDNNPAVIIDAENHDMITFEDKTGSSTEPYALYEKGGHGFRFHSYADQTDQRETVRITKDGQVGINLSGGGSTNKLNPDVQLDVEAEANPGVRIKTTNDDALLLQGTGNSTPFTIKDEADRGVRFTNQVKGAERLRIQPDGQIGIANSNPTAQLDINAGGRVGMKINTSSSDAIVFAGNSTAPFTFVDEAERGFRIWDANNSRVTMKISPQAEMVVGDASNGGELTVHSNDSALTGLKLPNQASAGALLTSDAVGNASWLALATFASAGLVPVGAIIMWSNLDPKSSDDLKDMGWAFCDGSTIIKQGSPLHNMPSPDLRGRFVVGRHFDDPDYKDYRAVGPEFTDARGLNDPNDHTLAKTVQLKESQSGLVSHDHEIDFEDVKTGKNGAHYHLVRGGHHLTGGGPYSGNRLFRMTDDLKTYHTYDRYTGTDANVAGNLDGEHEHSLDIKGSSKVNSGADAIDAHENRPPYYVLAFLIKI